MGTTTDAHCYGCGLDEKLVIGGGMQTFQTFASWPVCCRRCKGIRATNLQASPQVCLDCGSPDISLPEEAFGGTDEVATWAKLRAANKGHDPSTVGGGQPESVVDWFDHSLSKGRYRCPVCGAAELRFGTAFNGSSTIMWD